MGRDVIGAARRWNFKRRTDVHPVDAVEELPVAEGALAVAFAELGGMVTVEDRHALPRALQSRLEVPLGEAEERVTLGHWLVGQCGGSSPAISRLARRAVELGGPGAVDDATALIETVAPDEPTSARRARQDGAPVLAPLSATRPSPRRFRAARAASPDRARLARLRARFAGPCANGGRGGLSPPARRPGRRAGR